MKPIVAIALLVCSCATACKRDPETPIVWGRSVQPRLTGATWVRCERPDCGPVSAAANDECPPDIPTHHDALQVLASQPKCIDAAITALDHVARADPRALSDIAAAYYLRASRENGRKSDLLQALDAADRAIAILPGDAAALYNLALIRETLGLRDDAIKAWERLLTVDRTEWTKDAHQSLARLRKIDAPTQWGINKAELQVALRKGDRAAVRRLIAGFTSPAIDYLEQELLAENDASAARMLASELSARLHGDPYFPDLVETMERARDGHIAFRDAAAVQPPDAERYANAARLLEREGSLLSIAARIKQAEILASSAATRALEVLAPLEGKATKHHSIHLLPRIRSVEAYALYAGDQHFASLAAYDDALDTFSRLGDIEKAASLHRSLASGYRTIGAHDFAWRESLQALKYLSQTVDTRRRHMTLGETAETAVVLNHPEAALQYQDMAIRVIQKDIARTPPDLLDVIRQKQHNLGVAWRGRAAIVLALGRIEEAKSNLAEASLRMYPAADTIAQKALHARTFEVSGQALLPVDPGQAVTAFTTALSSLPSDKLRTFRASLYAQRADAAFRAGNRGDAARDLEQALFELQQEESELLKKRVLGKDEEFWSAYFSRFEETYSRLIGHLMDTGASDRAFQHGERARAFEPLDLILRLDTTPASFRKLLTGNQALTLDRIRPALPPGTFLLQYSVLEDRTYTWLVWHNGSMHIPQRARRTEVERWTRELQRSAHARDETAFFRAIQPPYQELFAGPLAEIAKLPGGDKPKRLVIVPDIPMQGIPFAALYDSRTEQYLIEKAPIAVAGSATLYIFSLLRDAALASASAPSVLLVGDPAFNTKLGVAAGLKQLRGAMAEVTQILPMYAPHAAVLTGKEATVPAFLAAARGKTILHFAGHSIAIEREPWHSALLLAPSPEHHGAIDAQELLKQLKLDHTRLVILASCSSAGGLPVGPEGVAPLVRPLIAAGVPAVIGSLWEVQDATTGALSVSFHRHYRKGHDAAEALQLAQLELLRSGNEGQNKATAWAPYQVIGHASSPFEPPPKQ